MTSWPPVCFIVFIIVTKAVARWQFCSFRWRKCIRTWCILVRNIPIIYTLLDCYDWWWLMPIIYNDATVPAHWWWRWWPHDHNDILQYTWYDTSAKNGAFRTPIYSYWAAPSEGRRWWSMLKVQLLLYSSTTFFSVWVDLTLICFSLFFLFLCHPLDFGSNSYNTMDVFYLVVHTYAYVTFMFFVWGCMRCISYDAYEYSALFYFFPDVFVHVRSVLVETAS